jgi:hypothetical protein
MACIALQCYMPCHLPGQNKKKGKTLVMTASTHLSLRHECYNAKLVWTSCCVFLKYNTRVNFHQLINDSVLHKQHSHSYKP